MFKISNVKDRNNELDIRVMPHTIHGIKAASFAECIFIGRSLDDLTKLKGYSNHLQKEKTH